MHKAKHFVDKKSGKIKAVVIFVSILFCLLAAGAATVAYVFMHTDPVENVFNPSHVACEVIENGPDENSPFDGETKTAVRIKNTGDVQSYIRAAVVVTWMSEDQSKVTAIKPEEGSDYEITYSKSADESSNWVLGKDGYWYYTVPVSIDSETTNLIERCVCKVTPPDGYYLSVEIVASSIQSTPESVVEEQWDSGISKVDVGYNELVYCDLQSCGCKKKEHDELMQSFLTRIDGTSLDMIKSKKIPSDNTSGVKGVYFQKGKWIAKIVFQKKQFHLGKFERIEDAAEARKAAEELIFDGSAKHYQLWKERAEADPQWAEDNPIRIRVKKINGALSVSFFPNLLGEKGVIV